MSMFPTLKWNRPIRPDGVGEAEGEVDHPDEFDAHSSLRIVAKEGMNLLQLHYPGHLWAIQINVFGRMFNIFNHALHDMWGYTIRADEVEHEPTRRRFVTAGGELLERFGLRRGRFNIDEYARLRKDIRGRCIPILNDLEHAAAKKELRKRAIVEAIEQGNTIVDSRGRTLVHVH